MVIQPNYRHLKERVSPENTAIVLTNHSRAGEIGRIGPNPVRRTTVDVIKSSPPTKEPFS